MNKNIGFVGTGVMGSSMVINLIKAGYTLLVYNRSKNKAEACLGAGAGWCDTIPELAKKSDVIITIVGFPKDVEESGHKSFWWSIVTEFFDCCG